MRKVLLTIRGTQNYGDQEPEVIELVTQGELEFSEGGWNIRYQESELTGLLGVTTTFRVEPDCILLTRKGRLTSRMEFRLGVPNESLYETEFGALMITVKATAMFFDITPEGGVVDLSYRISIENTESGEIDYHLLIQPMDEKG